MLLSRLPKLRALVAILLFAGSEGAPQLFDALAFHSGRRYHAEVLGLNNGKHCHAEKCDLGARIAPPPPVSLPNLGDRFTLISFSVAVFGRCDPPRTVPANAPLGSRAPPLNS
ncbi:MAG: hypothetical protein ACREK8_03185 [Gemmatimonadales bacterium]